MQKIRCSLIKSLRKGRWYFLLSRRLKIGRVPQTCLLHLVMYILSANKILIDMCLVYITWLIEGYLKKECSYQKTGINKCMINLQSASNHCIAATKVMCRAYISYSDGWTYSNAGINCTSNANKKALQIIYFENLPHNKLFVTYLHSRKILVEIH